MDRGKLVRVKALLAVLGCAAGMVSIGGWLTHANAQEHERSTVIAPVPLGNVTGAMAVASPNAPDPSPMRRASFAWIGDDGDDWSDPGSWTPTACFNLPCYPRTTNDDALFSGGFIVHLDGAYTIDDLTLDDVGGSYIDAESEANRKLTCDSVVISGDTGGEAGGVRVRNLACVETN